MKHDGEDWIFESGRRRHAFTEGLSLDRTNYGWHISYGSDGEFWPNNEGEREPKDQLSKIDLLELARHQIQKWQEFEQWLASSAGESR